MTGEGSEELPEGWVRWPVEPPDEGGRKTLEERLVGSGRLSSQFATKKVLARGAGSRLRTRFITMAVRGGFGLTNRREYAALFGGGYTEDCEVTWDDLFPDLGGGTQHGRAEIEGYMRAFDDAYSSMNFRPVEIVDPGGTTFGSKVEATVVGRTTGIPITLLIGVVWSFRDGQVASQRICRDWPTAMSYLIKTVQLAPAPRHRR